MSCTGSPVRRNLSGNRTDTQSGQLLREYSSQPQGHNRRDLARAPIIRRAGQSRVYGARRDDWSHFFSLGMLFAGLILLLAWSFTDQRPFFPSFSSPKMRGKLGPNHGTLSAVSGPTLASTQNALV